LLPTNILAKSGDNGVFRNVNTNSSTYPFFSTAVHCARKDGSFLFGRPFRAMRGKYKSAA
jgi:hypothetical protein